MAIDAYTGLPGGGKSFGVVKNVIIPALKRGQIVVTNIPLKVDGFAALDVPTAKLVQLERVPAAKSWIEAPPGAVVVIDEAYHWWPAGLKADAMPGAHRTFFAEHRHRSAGGFSTQIVVVVQDLSMVCNFVRALVDKTFRVVKLDAVGADNRYRVDVYQGAVTGQSPPQAKRIAQEYGVYESEVYSCYESQTQGNGSFGDQSRVDKRATVFKSFAVKAAIGALVALPLAVYGIYASLSSFKSDVTGQSGKRSATALPVTSSKNATPAPPTPTPQLAPQPSAVVVAEPAKPQEPKKPELSKTWRILGVAIRKDGSGEALLASATARRWINLTVCEYRGIDRDMLCDVDGEVVSYYSGNGGVFAAAVTAPGAVASNQ